MGLTALLCVLVGTVFPAYASFKALETRDPEDDRQWLTYWIIHTLVLLAERWVAWLFMWLPFYQEIKLLIILWMIAPQTQGAHKLFVDVVRPFLLTHASKLDPCYSATQAVIGANITNQLAKLVESQGPAAAEAVTKAVFSAENAARLAALAQADPRLVERALKMAVDSLSGQQQLQQGPGAGQYSSSAGGAKYF